MRLSYALCCSLLAVGCQSVSLEKDPRISNLARIARENFDVEVTDVQRAGAERDFVGFRTDHVVFSRRTDSNTWLFHDDTFGIGRSGGSFEGNEEQILDLGRRVLTALDIPAAEISDAKVLQEQTRVAERDPSSGQVRMGDIEKGRSLVLFSRSVAGVPVFSSRALMGFRRDGSPGFLEVHWPSIPRSVQDAAAGLAEVVEGGWRPLLEQGQEIESIQAGVVHSPALGFEMEILPAVRVVYAATGGSGRKPVRYYGAKGELLATPGPMTHPQQKPQTRAR